MGVTYHDLQWAETGERLTAETFEKYRKQGGLIVNYNIPESAARAGVSNPMVMIASDGVGGGGPKFIREARERLRACSDTMFAKRKALDLRLRCAR